MQRLLRFSGLLSPALSRCLILVGGSLGDLYGRRRIFACGVLLFARLSLVWSFANVNQLILARAVQG